MREYSILRLFTYFPPVHYSRLVLASSTALQLFPLYHPWHSFSKCCRYILFFLSLDNHCLLINLYSPLTLYEGVLLVHSLLLCFCLPTVVFIPLLLFEMLVFFRVLSSANNIFSSTYSSLVISTFLWFYFILHLEIIISSTEISYQREDCTPRSSLPRNMSIPAEYDPNELMVFPPKSHLQILCWW